MVGYTNKFPLNNNIRAKLSLFHTRLSVGCFHPPHPNVSESDSTIGKQASRMHLFPFLPKFLLLFLLPTRIESISLLPRLE